MGTTNYQFQRKQELVGIRRRVIAILLPLSYLYFKRAESYFADVI
jgi:hypothetical protein